MVQTLPMSKLSIRSNLTVPIYLAHNDLSLGCSYCWRSRRSPFFTYFFSFPLLISDLISSFNLKHSSVRWPWSLWNLQYLLLFLPLGRFFICFSQFRSRFLVSLSKTSSMFSLKGVYAENLLSLLGIQFYGFGWALFSYAFFFPLKAFLLCFLSRNSISLRAFQKGSPCVFFFLPLWFSILLIQHILNKYCMLAHTFLAF